MSSTYANVSIPSASLHVPSAGMLLQTTRAIRRALAAVVRARPSQGLHEMAARCESLQPSLARELRAAATRVSEG